MQANSNFHNSIGYTMAVAAVVALLAAVVAVPVLAQNTALPAAYNGVPPTARQAAEMPQFASRLARPGPAGNASRVVRPAKRNASRKSSGPACSEKQTRWIPDDNGIIYENGPVNGTTDAWTINFGYVVSDSFYHQGDSTVTGFDFGAWEFPGDILSSVDWSITTMENAPCPGDQCLGSGTISGSNLTDQFISTNQFGYDIDKITVSGLNVNVNYSTAWVNLFNASVPSGDPVYWDENSGIGCHSQGCPSQASENGVGTIPSESFDVVGNGGCPNCPPPAPCFHSDSVIDIIHDFTQSEGSSLGVTAGSAGNLYGATTGGDYGAGLIYKLAPHGQDWMFTPLYSFLGGINGSRPSFTVAPNGVLYGTAAGGIQNCGQGGTDYCGFIFRLRPSPTACTTALCGWVEDVLYEFSGNNNGGYPAIGAFDQAGNLYGTLVLPNNLGGIFELTPTAGGWTETLIYAFLGGADGSGANSLLLGPDGNLYGLTSDGGDLSCGYGGYGCGTAFQLVRSGNAWTKNIIYIFEQSAGAGNRDLHADGAGNLYGLGTQEFEDHNWCPYVTTYDDFIFGLSHTNGQWVYQVLLGPFGGQDYWSSAHFTTDLAGDIYDTVEWWKDYIWFDDHGLHVVTDYDHSAIYEDSRNLWFSGYPPYYVLFEPYDIAVDAKHVYGTTLSCGQYSNGTVWSVPY